MSKDSRSDSLDPNSLFDALRISEEISLRLFQTNASLIAISTVLDGRIIEVNDQFLKMLEFKKDEVIGKSSKELKIWLDFSQRDKIIKLVRQKGYVQNIDVMARTKSGKVINVLFSADIIQFDGQKYLLTIMNDITSRKLAEKALKSLNSELEIEREALQAKTVTLTEVLTNIETEKKQMVNHIQSNIDRIVIPILRLLEERVDVTGSHYISLLDNCLSEIASPFISQLEAINTRLTPREVEICHMIKNGFSSKTIASTLSISIQTVHKQRQQIRKKLGLNRQKVNLTSFLRNT